MGVVPSTGTGGALRAKGSGSITIPNLYLYADVTYTVIVNFRAIGITSATAQLRVDDGLNHIVQSPGVVTYSVSGSYAQQYLTFTAASDTSTASLRISYSTNPVSPPGNNGFYIDDISICQVIYI